MQEYLRARTPNCDQKEKEQVTSSHPHSSLEPTHPDYIAPKHPEVDYEVMLKNGLKRRAALIEKRRRSRTPPPDEEISTDNQSRQFENSVHKYVLAFFVFYFFWIMFK